MATITEELIRMDDGAFVASFDYDDTTMQITTIRVANTGARTYTIEALATATGRQYTVPVPPGTNIDQSVPQDVVNRLAITVDAKGNLRGVRWSAS